MNGIDELDSGKFNFFRSVDLRKEGRLINWNNSLELSVTQSSGRMGEPRCSSCRLSWTMRS